MTDLTSRIAVRRIAVSRLISVTGSAAAYTALMATIYERTDHSPWWLAVTLLLTFGIGGLLGPVAGHLGDIFDRRKVMLISDLASAAFFLGMGLVSGPTALIAFAFGSAVADLPFLAASRAAIPNLVDDEADLAWANSWVSIGVNAGITLGPVLGGVLVATVGGRWVFVANAVTYLVSFGLVWSVHRPFSSARDEEEEAAHRGVVAGFRFIRRDPVLLRIVLAFGVMVLGLGMGMVADRPLAEHFGVGDVGFGAIISCWGLGSVVGSFLGRRLTDRTEQRWIVFGVVGISATALGMGFSPVYWPILVFVFANGIFDAITIVADLGIKQRRTPDAVRSRVMAASESVWQITLALGYVLSGAILAAFGAQGLYVVAGLTSGAAACMLLPLLRRRSAVPLAPVEG
jgi:MFS family permease